MTNSHRNWQRSIGQLGPLLVSVSLVVLILPPWGLAEDRPTTVQDWKPEEIWSSELQGYVTSACFVEQRDRRETYYVCADEKLFVLSKDGGDPAEVPGIDDPVDRLVPLPDHDDLAFLAFELFGEQLLFFDGEGTLVARHGGHDGIRSVAVAGNTLVLGAAEGGVFNFQENDGQIGLQLRWSEEAFDAADVIIGDFGQHFSIGCAFEWVRLFTDDGTTTLVRNFGCGSLGVLNLSPEADAVAAINAFGHLEGEELVVFRQDRTLFRRRLGDASLGAGQRRIVCGHFVDEGHHQLAVLRGDGSVALFDSEGRPLNKISADETRQAIELGPRRRDHNTLLSCEKGRLRSFRFPAAMPAKEAEKRVLVEHPSKGMLEIVPDHSAQDLWAKALWLTLPGTGASEDEIGKLFTQALARASDEKTAIYASFGQTQISPSCLRA